MTVILDAVLRLDPLRATPDRQRPDGVEPADPMHQILTVLATLGLFGVSFATWATTVQVPFTGAIAMCGFGFGLLITVMAVTAKTQQRLRRLDLAVLVLALFLLVGWATSTLWFQPAYGTDEAAFEQYAATLLSHGHNPYGADLSSALNVFRVPIQYATYTLNGGMVSRLGYPALPVLLVLPFVSLTHGVQSVVILNVVAMMAAVVAVYVVLPRRVRPLAVVTIVGLPIIFGYAVAGVNAVILMTLMVLVANRWSRTGATGRLTRPDVVRACCFGLAMSTQQLAWFAAPFLVLGIYLLRRGHLSRAQALGVTLRWSGIAGAVFVVINLPFIVWNPSAWLHGVTDPLTQHAIPYGQGLVDVVLFFRVGGGNLGLLTLAGGAAMVGLLLAYGVFFRRLGRAAFVLPSVALFLPTRSLAEYFMTLVAVWIVSTATTSAAEFQGAADWSALVTPLRPLGRFAVMAFCVQVTLPAVALAAAACTTPAPLAMRIDTVNTTGQLQSVWRITLDVRNRSAHALRPHFATNYQGQASTFWNVLSGPAVLPAHAHSAYVLAAPNMGSMPGITTPFVVQAVTASPQTISSTALFTPQHYSAWLTPGYVNKVLHQGDTVRLNVQLRSPFGALVHQAGVRVALAQLIYDQTALIPGETSINGSRPGATPVYAVTDASGAATFTVRDATPQDKPISMQAWVEPVGSYPYGYSEIVPLLWALSG